MSITFIGNITVGVLILSLAVASRDVSADTLFKCKDADGHTYFQDTKCGGLVQVSSKIMLVKTSPHASATKEKLINGARAEVVIKQSDNGIYYLNGSINETPVLMLVDTGASYLTLPTSLANRLGLGCDSEAGVSTSNGEASFCKTTVRTLQIGSITLSNVLAAYSSNVSNILLGQSVLNSLKVEQSKGVLRLSSLE